MEWGCDCLGMFLKMKWKRAGEVLLELKTGN